MKPTDILDMWRCLEICFAEDGQGTPKASQAVRAA
jgi:hypothetical protein